MPMSTLEKTREKVDVNDRKIINGLDADVIQLHPMKHTFAWEAYNAGNANHWLPTEINMQNDIEQWKSNTFLTEDERHALKVVLGFFTTADSLVANNLVLALYKHITSPECRLYLLRQSYEEAIHTHSYQYIVESLGLDGGEIFNMYREVEAIYNKAEFVNRFSEGILDPNFKTGTFENDKKFLENLISFAVMFSFQRQNKMVGSAEQIQYIMRDESQHLNFGIELINTIKSEQPELWTEEFKQRIIGYVKQAVDMETTFAITCFPRGIFGINAESFKKYIEYIADRRLQRINLPAQFGSPNPFPWMSETIDLSKEKNFFETRVTEYQTGGTLSW